MKPRNDRSLSQKRKKKHESSSQEESPATSNTKSSRSIERKKQKLAETPSNKESILSHFEKIQDMAAKSATAENADFEMELEEGEEPSNRDLMLMLKDIKTHFSTKLDRVAENVEELKGEVFLLKQENDKLKAELSDYKKREEAMQRKVEEAAFEAKLAFESSDRNEQYSRRNNIKILYVEEKKDGFETTAECEQKVIRILHDKLQLRNIKPEEIEATHRVGEKKEGQTRPIIVKFLSRKTKTEVIYNRRKLKNISPKLVIVEDLTKRVYTLYRQAADHPGTVRCWTTEGRIFAKDMDSKIHRIDTTADLRKLSIDVPPSSSASTRRQQFQGRWTDVVRSPPPSQTPVVSRKEATSGGVKGK